MDLNSKLIELKELYCVKCENFLNCPVMLMENIGHVCGRCFVKEPANNILSFHDVCLENIIKSLDVPCRYKSEGCNVKLLYDEISCHEEYCPYRQYNCPSKENCVWRGAVGKLAKHFEESHTNILLKSDSLNFEFEIDLTQQFAKHMLLLTNTESFLLQLLMEDDVLWCTVCYIGDEDRGLNYEFFIEEIGYKSSFYFRNDSRKAMLSQSFMQNLDKDRAIRIEMAPLKIYFINASQLFAKLKIIGGEIVEEIDESFLAHLECPVCSLYMLPPIHQCLTGHNICYKCKPKLTQCPTCRGRIENTRNYALEAVTAKTKYPCLNRIHGCMVVLSGSLIEKHEQECKLRTYNCVVQTANCTWQGKYSDLLEHLQKNHKVNDKYQTKINYSGNQHYVYTTNYDILIAFGEIFKVGHKYENNSQTTFWNCRVFGIKNKSKYKYRITYTNDMGDFMLVKSGLCLPYTTDEDFFNHNLAFPMTLSSRVGNTVKCEIFQL